jgi:hypothetical protein
MRLRVNPEAGSNHIRQEVRSFFPSLESISHWLKMVLDLFEKDLSQFRQENL